MNDLSQALDSTPVIERHTQAQARHSSIWSGAWFSSNPLKTVLAVGCIFAWLAAVAWFRPLAAPDEGRYVGVAWEMLRSGDWLVPRLNGLPFFHKPPLFYWISAIAMSVFGVSEWPARLPSLIGATFAAAGLFLFLRRWVDAATAKLSTVVLVTTPFFYIGAQFANLDMLVAGCIAATVLLAVHVTLTREQGQSWRWALASTFLFAALGVLAKGLIGLVLPGAIFVLWCLATRRYRAMWLMAWPPGWILFLGVAGPWFVAMQLRYPEFFDYFVITQHFRRFAASGFNNEHPVWFYLPVIAGLTLPWFGWLLFAKRSMWGRRSTLSDVDWLMVIWGVVIVVFFSVPRSKLIGYVLPALPPLAYLISRVAGGAATRMSRGLDKLRWTAVVSGVACIASVVLVGRLAVPPGAQLRLPAPLVVVPGDQVLMLDSYFYEIPFYWRLRQPVLAASTWDRGSVKVRDDWRKELRDAADFASAQASTRLVELSDLQAALCVPRTTWLIGPSNAFLAHPWIAKVPVVTYNTRAAVWRFDGDATGNARCLEKANTPALRPS